MDTLTKLYITSIEMDFDVLVNNADPMIFHSRVYCEDASGIKLSFPTNVPAQYHVGDVIMMNWKLLL